MRHREILTQAVDAMIAPTPPAEPPADPGAEAGTNTPADGAGAREALRAYAAKLAADAAEEASWKPHPEDDEVVRVIKARRAIDQWKQQGEDALRGIRRCTK